MQKVQTYYAVVHTYIQAPIVEKFTEYMDMTMNKPSKENKLIVVMGYFNLNLLNCESHSETNDFLNRMVSHFLLPYILHQTR